MPQNGEVRWTNLTQSQIGECLLSNGLCVSLYYVRMLLKLCGYKKRKMLKMKTVQEVEHRNEQFEYIAACRDLFEQKGLPILSIDTKNKELLGDYGRSGKAYSTATRTTSDHDFAKKGDIKMVPHGIYDVSKNRGYITLGTNQDTSEFVCDNLERCWTEHLQYEYPNADTMLILCDGGGSNAAAHYIVKMDLIKLANKLKVNILVAHYPPYCSKWNPIEHRLFAQISHTWDGLSLYDLAFVKNITDTTTTKTGLKVITTINEKVYQKAREVPQEFKDNIKLKVHFDDKLPKWNYLIKVA